MQAKEKGFTLSATFSLNNYITHLPIQDEVRGKLLNEFYEFESKAKKWEAKGHVLDMLDVIRNEDVEDCQIANDVAWNLASIIGCEVFPRYYRQTKGTVLRPHKDLGTACALNVILKGTSPITWDEKYDVEYSCALLNVQQTHHVKNDDTRIFLKLSIFDSTYHEVVETLRGKENDIFDIN